VIYVPNRIEIPTHVDDLGHHKLRRRRKLKNHQWSHRNRREEEERKREERKGRRVRSPLGASVTPDPLMRPSHAIVEDNRTICTDATPLLSRVKQIGVTQKRQI
jgi:hypothetical protein